MSPEQARGEQLDNRSDLFSLGAVLYEMVTGQRAFKGTTPALIFDGILNRVPESPSRLNPGIPAALERVIDKAMEKDRALRYQHAADLVADLRRVKRAMESGTLALLAAPRLPARRAVLVVSLLAAVALAAGGYFWTTRQTDAAAPLTEKDSIVLGEIANRTGDTVFDGTLRQALAVQSGQSPFLDILPDERIVEALRLGNHPRDERLTATGRPRSVRAPRRGRGHRRLGHAARSVVRADADGRGVWQGERPGAGAGQRREPRKGAPGARPPDVLDPPAPRRIARDTGEVRPAGRAGDDAVARCAARLHARPRPTRRGQTTSSRSRSSSAPSSSIPISRWRTRRCRRCTATSASRSEARSTSGAPYESRSRVTERERLFITFQYDDRITEDELRAIETLEVWKRSYPRDYRAPNALCLLYSRMGQYQRAVEEGTEAMRRNPAHPFPYSNLAYAYRGMNRYDEAKRIANEAVAHKFETLPTRRLLYQLDMIAGHDAEAATQLEWAQGRARAFDLIGAEAQVAAYRGRMASARDLYTQTIEMAVKGGFNEVASGYAVQYAWTEALFGNADAAAKDPRSVSARTARTGTTRSSGDDSGAGREAGSGRSHRPPRSRRRARRRR